MDSNLKPDILKAYFLEPIEVEGIKIYQPTIGDIIKYGELQFWLLANQLCCNPTSMRVPLWHAGIDWNKVDDFELFASIVTTIPVEKTSIIFGDLDWTKFRAVAVDKEDKETDEENKDNYSFVLVYMPNPTIQVDKEVYQKLVGYLRIIFNIFPKTEKIKGKLAKEWTIEEEEQKMRIEEQKQKNEKWSPSALFPLISSLLNHPGFKYKKNELKEVGIVEFMDSIRRLQVYENTTALMSGVYSGMLDTSKINLENDLNWTKDIYS